ncbi:S-adenosyl-L-methionine-dependent methyltransferase [Spinellus fusiger]|nr:S-adenosyl-L-methionine-dependent methyltransferase [Spinellus fusiger]
MNSYTPCPISSSPPSEIVRRSFIQKSNKYDIRDSNCWYPIDEKEIDRLVGLHFALKTMFGSSIPHQEELQVDLQQGISILDLGCGPGTWLMEIATEYSSCECIGIDLCDIFPNAIRPVNATFHRGNVTHRLPFPDHSFEFVQLRMFIIALNTDQWVPVMKEIYRVLKPVREMITSRHQDPYIADKLQDHLETTGFTIVYHEQKSVDLNQPGHLSNEFLWVLRSMLSSGETFFSGLMKDEHTSYSHLVETFSNDIRAQNELEWSFVYVLGQKPPFCI